ncbi:hypothetical protein CGRA01v4_08898 [Colletotrichum graminicola]|nr:hypothetical protein CGRA01v4_08898 [Colletotrichum graminicola]
MDVPWEQLMTPQLLLNQCIEWSTQGTSAFFGHWRYRSSSFFFPPNFILFYCVCLFLFGPVANHLSVPCSA